MPSILEVVGPRDGAAPLTYTLTEMGTVDVMSIFAEFDGSGAGGTFRPVVTVRSQSGAILARCFPSDTVAAGDSADVTFAPFLREGGGGTAGTLETTDGSTTVDPTDTLEIGYGLVLTNPSFHTAHIALAAVATDYPTVVSTISDLVSYWEMDDPIGDQADTAGFATPKDLVRAAGSTIATYEVAAPDVVVATGDTGGAVQLNYNTTTDDTSRTLGDTFSATDVALARWAFSNRTQLSVSLWIKIGVGWTVPSNAAPVGIVSTQSPSGSGIVEGWGLYVYPPSSPAGNLVPYAHRGGGGTDSDLFAPTYSQLTPGEWFHLGYSYDGSRMFLWLNGVPINSTSSTVNVTGFQTIHVGSGDWNLKTNLLYGTLARVAIYSRALSSSEWLKLALVA